MPTVAELLAALPAEDELRQDRAEELEAIFQSLAGKKTPTSAFRRLCSLGGLSSRLAMGYLAYWVRTWYKPREAREKDLLETNLRMALKTLETMGYLRGAVAKVGQLIPVFPESAPREFVDVLSSLQFQAPPMHFSLIREQLINEIGDPEELFSEFDETAVAAASLGQVHRARLKSGEEVAVKIQYPGIARTIRTDLGNLRALMRPFHRNSSWEGLEMMFEEVRTGLEAETDYEREARNLQEVGRLFRDDEEVVTPRVYEHASTNRVLTMDFIEGRPLSQYLATNPTQEDRDHFGRVISKVLYRIYVHKMLYTDAHPGNFLFQPNGVLGLLDCGNIRYFNEAEWQYHLDVAESRFGDEAEVRALCMRSLMMTEEDAQAHPEMLKLVIEGLHYYNEPVSYEGLFDYGDPSYLQRGAEWLSRTAKQRWVKQMPVNVFSHRLNFQLPALLYQLKSRVNVPDVVRAEPYGLLNNFPEDS